MISQYSFSVKKNWNTITVNTFLFHLCNNLVVTGLQNFADIVIGIICLILSNVVVRKRLKQHFPSRFFHGHIT